MPEHHELTLHVTPTGSNTVIEVDVSEPKTQPQPKPRLPCCPQAPVWWEEASCQQGHEPGWTGMADCAINIRTFWLYNPKFCPMCGTKVPESLPR